MTTSSGADTAPSIRQHTLRQSALWRNERRRRRGDVLVVHPAEADTGVRFMIHGAVPAARTIAARWDAVVDARGGMVLGNTHGLTLRGAVPLLAALRVAGVDNAVVEVQGSRIPAEVSDFDFYLGMLADIGTQAQIPARQLLRLVDTVEVRDRFGFVKLSPATEFGARVYLTDARPDGCTGTACLTLVSDFTEPHAGLSATRDGAHAEKLIRTGDGCVSRPLREIRALPKPLRASVVEMIGHLVLAGAPLASHVHSHGSGPVLYQALLHAVMKRGAALLTTVDAHRARLNSVSGIDGK